MPKNLFFCWDGFYTPKDAVQSWTQHASILVLLFKLLTIVIWWDLIFLITRFPPPPINVCFIIVSFGKLLLIKGQNLGIVTATSILVPPDVTNCCVATVTTTLSPIHIPHTVTADKYSPPTREPHRSLQTVTIIISKKYFSTQLFLNNRFVAGVSNLTVSHICCIPWKQVREMTMSLQVCKFQIFLLQ